MRWLGLVVVLGAMGCLPGDGRPEPGELLVEAQRSDEARDGFVTDDGWAVHFDRFVTALGGVGLGDEAFDVACIDYSLSFYDRLYDFAVADTSKLNLHYGLGTCTLRYRMGSPSDRTILMAGTSEADRELLRDARIDGIFGDDEDEDAEEGVGLLVEGSASKDGEQKRFRWLIRQNHAISRCLRPDGSPFRVTLEGGDELVRAARVLPRELFRKLPDDDAPVLFAPYALADADADGVVTLEELQQVQLPAGPILEALAGDSNLMLPGQVLSGQITLRELLEKILFPRVASFEGVQGCEFIISGLSIEGVEPPDGD